VLGPAWKFTDLSEQQYGGLIGPTGRTGLTNYPALPKPGRTGHPLVLGLAGRSGRIGLHPLKEYHPAGFEDVFIRAIFPGLQPTTAGFQPGLSCFAPPALRGTIL
jgi:hypothetical protein